MWPMMIEQGFKSNLKSMIIDMPRTAEHDTKSGLKTNFTSLKPVLAFQTLTLAMLSKWARTHESVFFFLRKKCSWTLLPGSTWLHMPITRLYRSSDAIVSLSFVLFPITGGPSSQSEEFFFLISVQMFCTWHIYRDIYYYMRDVTFALRHVASLCYTGLNL